jgi:hypothetical protein
LFSERTITTVPLTHHVLVVEHHDDSDLDVSVHASESDAVAALRKYVAALVIGPPRDDELVDLLAEGCNRSPRLYACDCHRSVELGLQQVLATKVA